MVDVELDEFFASFDLTKLSLEEVVFKYDFLRMKEAEYKFYLKKVTNIKETLELSMISSLQQADVKDMNVNKFVFGLKETKRTALDQQLLKEKYPEQYKDCYVEKTKEGFYFKGV